MKLALAWGSVLLYVGITVGLTIRGMMKSSSLESYAVGNKDISPVWIGLSLSAQLTSVATFVINPGLVYAFGWAGLMGYGVAAGSGIILGLLLFSRKFRDIGTQVQAITLPQWIGARYESPGLRLLFSFLSLALITFAVLIVVAIGKVLSPLLGVHIYTLVIGTVIFVFVYVVLGGVSTHAYTNAVQALIMLAVAIILFGHGIPLLFKDGGILAQLHAKAPHLATIVNAKSPYFRNLFEVFVCNFLVGLAIVCQPHIVSKALYLKEEKDVNIYLMVAIAAGVVFLSVMFVGLYARVTLTVPARIDNVVALYILKAFSDPMQVLIGIGIMCAGFSTLEGIILALFATFSSDLYMGWLSKKRDSDNQERDAIWFARLSLVAVGIVTIVVSIYQIKNPTGGSVAIFAQYGVYLLFTGAFFPLACGMFLPRVSRGLVTASVMAALGTFLFFGLFRRFVMPAMGADTMKSLLKFPLFELANNPAVLGAFGIIAGWIVIGVGLMLMKKEAVAEAA
jgi:SSS family solute:Na+ symporter/sodium/pantothenate symporter